jgi:hypothetical protein
MIPEYSDYQKERAIEEIGERITWLEDIIPRFMAELREKRWNLLIWKKMLEGAPGEEAVQASIGIKHLGNGSDISLELDARDRPLKIDGYIDVSISSGKIDSAEAEIVERCVTILSRIKEFPDEEKKDGI